jgi:hypothetical protein
VVFWVSGFRVSWKGTTFLVTVNGFLCVVIPDYGHSPWIRIGGLASTLPDRF